MKRNLTILLLPCVFLTVETAGPITYDDHIKPILRQHFLRRDSFSVSKNRKPESSRGFKKEEESFCNKSKG